MSVDEKALLLAAYEAKENAYAPYSHFCVGAALLCSDGRVFTGCNVENASYGATGCAERTALYKAISEGARDFCAIAIVGEREGERMQPCPPCGICRQVMAELCPKDLLILLCDRERIVRYTAEELLPCSFDLHSMGGMR